MAHLRSIAREQTKSLYNGTIIQSIELRDGTTGQIRTEINSALLAVAV